MRNDYVKSREGRDLLTAEIEEFQAELNGDYHTFSSLRDFGMRYTRFAESLQTASGKEGELAKKFLEATILKLTKGSVKLVASYPAPRVSNGDREPLSEVFIQITELLENASDNLKDATENDLNYLANKGGL